MIISNVDVSLLIWAIIVALISGNNRRTILWIGVAALSYINATIAWRVGLPYAEAITGLGDAGVCLAVYFAGRYRWELWMWRLFQTSVAISLLYLAGHLGITANIPHEIYAISLEGINWILLIFIGGMGVAQRLGAYNVRASGPWPRVHRAMFSLHRERKNPQFLKAR